MNVYIHTRGSRFSISATPRILHQAANRDTKTGCPLRNSNARTSSSHSRTWETANLLNSCGTLEASPLTCRIFTCAPSGSTRYLLQVNVLPGPSHLRYLLTDWLTKLRCLLNCLEADPSENIARNSTCCVCWLPWKVLFIGLLLGYRFG
jgi:hypothetical protein